MTIYAKIFLMLLFAFFIGTAIAEICIFGEYESWKDGLEEDKRHDKRNS